MTRALEAEARSGSEGGQGCDESIVNALLFAAEFVTRVKRWYEVQEGHRRQLHISSMRRRWSLRSSITSIQMIGEEGRLLRTEGWREVERRSVYFWWYVEERGWVREEIGERGESGRSQILALYRTTLLVSGGCGGEMMEVMKETYALNMTVISPMNELLKGRDVVDVAVHKTERLEQTATFQISISKIEMSIDLCRLISVTMKQDSFERNLSGWEGLCIASLVPHQGIDIWLQDQIFYDHVNPVTRRTIDQSAGGKLRDRNTKESWALLEDLALYDNESWNDPRDFAKLVKVISLPQDVPSTSDRHLIKLENQVQCLIEAHLSSTQPNQVNKITTSYEICSGPHDTHYCMKDPEQASVEYSSSRTDEVGGEEEAPYWTTLGKRESYKPHPSSDGVGAQIPYYARKDFLDCHFPREWEIARDVEINPFKDVLMFGRMVEFLGAIPINLKSNMWESKDLINIPINRNKPPKNRDGAWHAKIRLIDPDGEEFTKTLQSIPTTRKLSERESPREIIDLDHFYDT
ncbi:hypothetical protein Tco_1106919 [Tanacetum coccineum]